VVFCTVRRAFCVVASLVLTCSALGAIQGYLWTYDHTEQKCKIRKEAYSGGDDRSLWSIWSWFSEMLIFLVVPLAALIVNILVIREIRLLSGRTLAETAVMDGSTARRAKPVPGTSTTKSPSMSVSYKIDPLMSPRSLYGSDIDKEIASRARNSSLPDGATPCKTKIGNGRTGKKVHSLDNSDTAGFSFQKSITSDEAANGVRSSASFQRRPASAQAGNAATNVMLLTVSFYLILMTLPATLVYVTKSPPSGEMTLTQDEISRDPKWQYYFFYVTTKKIVDEICISHYACNLFLFLITGERFRSAFVAFFRRCCKTRDDSWSGNGFQRHEPRNGYSCSRGGEPLVQHDTVSTAI